MDRETLAQAVAMLVVLAALARWLPPGDSAGALGLGDPWRSVEIDRSLLAEGPGSRQGAAMLRAMFRRDGSIARWRRLLEAADQLRARTGAADVIQLRGVSRNDLWSLAYDLYPARVVGAPVEEGGSSGDTVRADASWVLTLPGPKEPPRVERGPAGASDPLRDALDAGLIGDGDIEPAR
jgi:hypothetical protein